MSGVFHSFLDNGEGRCEHVMPTGAECGRLAGSHHQDLRCDDRHLNKKDRHLSKKDRHKSRPPKKGQTFVFWDDEGKGEGAEHRLIYGAGVDENGKVILEIDSADGVSQPPPEVWLDAILEVGRRIKQRSMFSFGFGYDRTKMLEGLPPKTLYMLTHREHREMTADGKRPIPLYWGEYILDLQGTRFSVAKARRLPDGRHEKDAKGKRKYDRMTVWDVLKFFQCPFVDALEAWRRKESKGENLESELIIPDDELERMRLMKSKRAEFDKLPWEDVKRYCQSECYYGAKLVRELVKACERIGVNLHRFDGAGSISDALMRNQGVSEHMSEKNVTCIYVRDAVKKRALHRAVMSAFAGGRFEAPYCGIQRGDVYAKDICSAYPYAMYLHPCLAHGKWEHITEGGRGVDKRIERADLALIRVHCIGRDKGQALGSLHNRDADGNITFPIDNKTWTWKPEYIAARDAMKDRLKVREAFIYRTECDHRPFRFMAQLYLERLRIGKEGRGIAMKLGYNGCAGKTMQRVGSHKWQEYIWAGNTTSRTRAQLLEAIGCFRDQWKVCYLATDSVFALEDVRLPEPENTYTLGAAEWGKPPLGAWESAKTVYRGMCFVRPGIAFPLNATAEQLKEIKARGISKSVLLDHVGDVVELMSAQKTIEPRKGEPEPHLSFTRRIFAGMKMSLSKRGKPVEYHAADNYGQWYDQDVKIKLAAQPKRFVRVPGEEGMLLPWPDKPESLPYDFRKRGAEARALEALQDVLLEQPDLDMADFRE